MSEREDERHLLSPETVEERRSAASPEVPKSKSHASAVKIFGLSCGILLFTIACFAVIYSSWKHTRAGSMIDDNNSRIGPTKTGAAPFLAETNPAPFSNVHYRPVTPIETQVPIKGNINGSNIFELHGALSHYFPNPVGFGVDEYPLPDGAKISFLNMLSRHGARYPTIGAGPTIFAQKFAERSAQTNFSGSLSFLNDWTYTLGYEILTPLGREELYESGTLHYFQYGHLYENNGGKILARTTTQHRMRQSAEYFLIGFFGSGWNQNATLQFIIEDNTARWNNTLAGHLRCDNNVDNWSQNPGRLATKTWHDHYLADATKRLNNLSPGFDWTTADSYNAQDLCAYETVALGYSQFCSLFTIEEWQGYEYSYKISFAGNSGFQSPTGRAIGIGYVQEILARLRHELITEPVAQVNVTLDSDPESFPLNQKLFFDFSHDTNIMSILTAFGLTQFAEVSPEIEMNFHDVMISHLTPFAARLDIEVIDTAKPVSANRKSAIVYNESGGPTKYIHFVLNQRTIPLHKSFSQCEYRDDGWCEMSAFLDSQKDSLSNAQFDYSCFGKYEDKPYGSVKNGVP